MKNIILLIIGLFLGFNLQLFSQFSRIDSLKKELSLHKQKDTIRINLLNKIAKEYNIVDNKQTYEYAREAQVLSDSLDYLYGKTVSLYWIGVSQSKTNPDKALSVFYQLLNISRSTENKKIMAMSLRSIGVIYYNRGEYDKTLEFYKRAIALANEEEDVRFVANTTFYLGSLYSRMGQLEQSVEEYGKALDLYEQNGNVVGVANCCSAMGIVFERQGNIPLAIESHQKCIRLFKQLNNKDGLAKGMINLGGVYLNQKEYAKAIECNQEALHIAEEINQNEKIAASLLNIGIASLKLNRPEAIQYLDKALDLGEKNNLKYLTIDALFSLGSYYKKNFQYEEALKYFSQSMKLSESLNKKLVLSETYYEMASVYFEQQKTPQALDFATKGLALSQDAGVLLVQKDIHKLLSEINASKHNFKDAYKHSLAFNVLNDSLYNESNVKKIAQFECQSKYDKELQSMEAEQIRKDAIQAAELKQQQIIIIGSLIAFIMTSILLVFVYRLYHLKQRSNKQLIKQKEEIETKNSELIGLNKKILAQKEEISEINSKVEQQNHELQILNATKDKFFGIIAHDLKNPFNSIIGFSNLAIESATKNMIGQTIEYAEITRDSALVAFKLLENLLKWSQSQTGEIRFMPEPLPLAEVLLEPIGMCNHQAMEKQIEVSVKVPEDHVVYADRNMLATIVRNLLTNAIKYTHKDGKIVLSSYSNSVETIITVSDNGIGMDNDTISKLFKINEKVSVTGTEHEQGTGIGLILCKEFVEKNGGEIWVESTLNQGSRFSFTVPNGVN
jgi:signal transduction histidine kinase/TPR repeat protein